MPAVRSALAAVGWLVAALAIAFGAAGLVTAMDAPPAGAQRPELTRRGDLLVTPQLDAIEADLKALTDEVAELGTHARGALASLNGSDIEAVEAAIAEGDEVIARIDDRASRIRQAFLGIPLLDTPAAGYELSAHVQDRAERLRLAVDAVDGLQGAWVRLSISSVAASRLSGLLQAHDTAVLDAAALGRDAEYAAAVEALDGADQAIADSRALRDVLANTVEVTTLDEWLRRNERYDQALRALYTALDDADGRVTDEVRAGMAEETEARAQLPPDSRGLILIFGDIGRSGMNGAVIAIEQARGALSDVIDADPTAAPAASPSGVPSAAAPTAP